MITIGEPPFSLTYAYAGLFIAQEEWIHPNRQIDTWELIYVMNGTNYLEQGEQYAVSKGEILLLEPYVRHGGFRISEKGTSFYWVHFTPSDFAALGITERHLVFADGYKFAPLFKQLLHVANSFVYPSYGVELILGMILTEAAAPCKSHEQTSVISRCAEWIRVNSDRKLTVAMAAEYCGYNADYLCTLFKRMMGVALKPYINTQRMQYMKNMLVTTDYSMKQLADHLGFETENQMNHYFKYHEKMSPTQYRSLYTRTHINKK